MKATDLRVNNYMAYHGIPVMVKAVAETSAEFKYFNKDSIGFIREETKDFPFAVPLAPDKVLALGFTKLEGREGFWKEDICIDISALGHYTNTWSVNRYGFLKSIKFVHQLQNLYFALKDEDLIYKE